MPIADLIELCKAGGGILAPFLLLALIWMNGERKEAVSDAKESNSKLRELSEKTIVLLTELKAMANRP